MVVVTVMSLMSVNASACDTSEVSSSNWMSCLPDDIPLNELSIPGAHDATAVKTRYFTQTAAQTQSLFTDDMLKAGVRYFDLRIYKKNNDFYMCHQSVNCKNRDGSDLKLQTVIDNMTGFLDENPGEALILQIKSDRDGNKNDQSIADYFKDLALQGKIYIGDTVPTLGQARGKMVILSRLDLGKDTSTAKYQMPNCDDKQVYWAIDVHTFNWGDEKNKTMTLTAEDLDYEVWTEDEFDVTRNEKWDYITNSLLGDKSAAVRRDAAKDAGKHAWSIVYTSLSHQSVVGVIGEIALPFFNFDPIVFPKDGADTINPKLLTLLREYSDLYTGCLVCDFINAELAGTIYMRNFNR